MDLNKDEADGGHHVDGKNWGASEETGNDRDKDNNSNGGDDVNVDVDEAKEDDYIEMLDRFIGGNHPEDCIVVDWLKGECCIECKSKDGQVLFCSENNCPLAFHEVCMTWKPKFDDMGKFYCPYCLYKQEMVGFKELRTKFMLAEEGLSNFIRLARDGGRKEKKMEGAPVSTMAGEESTGDCENEQNDDGKEKCDEGSTFVADGFDNDGKGERVVEDMENSSGSKGDATDEDQRQIRPSSSSHVGIVEDTLHVSRKVTSDIVGLMEENQGQRDEEEPKLRNPVGTSLPSKVPVVESCGVLSLGLVTENLVAGEKLDEQTDESCSAMNMNMNQEGSSATTKIVGLMEENQGQRDEEEPKLQNPVGTSLPSKVPAVESCEFLSLGLVTENLVAGEKLDEQTDESSSAMNMNQEGSSATTKISLECRKSANPLMNPIVMDAGKRKRLNWTAEEEEMLKELVPSFAREVNKNIPWRKILDQGCSVFHSTRTPSDLKDKWKKIAPKESQKDDEEN